MIKLGKSKNDFATRWSYIKADNSNSAQKEVSNWSREFEIIDTTLILYFKTI